MPTLNWIGKDKVVNHHRDVPFKVLEHNYGFSAEKGELDEPVTSGNKIIHGDNLEALKSLLPEYEGKVDCIYIDPPYNTGNEKWVYNDNVNHPKIKKWLGEVVGKEGDDLTRHDKWLCMMYPRVKLLHQLLSEEGVMFISIDDNEQANLQLLCDEIFGHANNIGPIIQNKMNAKNDTVNIQKNHEFILVYRKRTHYINGTKVKPTLVNKDFKIRKVLKEGEKYYFINDAITTRGEGGVLNARPNLGYTVYFHPEKTDKIAVCDYDIELAKTSNDFKKIYTDDQDLIKKGYLPIRPPKVRGKLGCWTWSLDKFNAENELIVITGKKGSYAVKKRTFVDSSKVEIENDKAVYKSLKKGNSRSILDYSTNEGTISLNNIIRESNLFDNPKNIKMIEYLIQLVNKSNPLVLDSFAGSGTTAHAVLNLNRQDGGRRKFILIEMEDYANNVTSERVKRVIKGFGTSNKKVEGTGGDFNFYELGLPLFNENENLNEEVGIDKIREYIWYSETRTSFDNGKSQEGHYLGKKDDTAYYFVYDKNALTTLDYDSLSEIKEKAEQYVIYADNCLLPKEFMLKNNIVFKKITRDITRF